MRLALAQDGDPGEAGLEAVEDELFPEGAAGRARARPIRRRGRPASAGRSRPRRSGRGHWSPSCDAEWRWMWRVAAPQARGGGAARWASKAARSRKRSATSKRSRVAAAAGDGEGEAAGLGAGEADVLVEEREQAGLLGGGDGQPSADGQFGGHVGSPRCRAQLRRSGARDQAAWVGRSALAKARAASLPIQRAVLSGEAARRAASARASARSAGSALPPMARSAQATRLPDEVALVGGGGLDQGEAAGEVGLAAVQREAGEEREAGAAAELVVEGGPGLDHGGGAGDAVEELEAGGVDDRPVVEVGAPAVHLRGRHQGGVVDQAGDGAGLVPAGLPRGRRRGRGRGRGAWRCAASSPSGRRRPGR